MAAKKALAAISKFEGKIKGADLKGIDAVISEIENSELSQTDREDLLIEAGVKVNELKQAANINPEKETKEYREAERKAMDESIKNAPKPSEKKWVKYKDDAEVNKYYEEGKVVGHDPGKNLVLLLSSFALAFMLMFQGVAHAAVAMTDEAVLGNQRWRVTSAGHLLPATTGTYTIGDSTASPSSIWVNGSQYSSFSAGTDGNWTGDGLVVTLDIAPTKFIATASSGDFFATGFTAGTGDVTFGQGGKIDGDTNGTMKLIEASDTLSFIFSGTTIQLDSSDGGFQFGMTDATEGQVDFLTNNDTDDYLSIKTVSNVPTIITSGTSNLELAPDGGTTVVTGALTVSTTGTFTTGLTSSSTLTLQNSETIVNSTNGTVEVGGATSTILSVLDTGTSDTDATLQLRADNSADNGDDWQVQSDGTTNSLFFRNDTSGSQATILTLSAAGLLTTTGDVLVAGTTPLVTIGDAGDEDAGIQIDSDTNDFYIASENTLDDFMIGFGSVIGTTPILTITDAGVATSTGSTDGDLTVYGAGTTASDAYLRLVGDAGADAADRWQLFNDSSAGDLIIQNDTSVAGTYVTKLTVDGSTGNMTMTGDIINENADSILMNTDDSFVFTSDDEVATVQVLGFEAKNARVQIWADEGDDDGDKWNILSNASGNALTITNTASTTLMTLSTVGDWIFAGTTPYLTIGDAGAEDAGLAFDGSAQDFNISLDDSATLLVIGLGTAAGTTDAIRIDANQVVTFVQDVRGLGTDDLSGFLQTQTAITTVAITAAQCGGTFVGDSADVIVLPEASTVLGCRLTFIAGTADDVDIDPADATDQFGPMSVDGAAIDGAAGDEYRMTDIGTSMTVEAIGADVWGVVASNGPITDVN